MNLLGSLTGFGVGFLTRPLGAIVLGRLADRRGREPAMVASFLLMGASTVGLAGTPNYASIGTMAGAGDPFPVNSGLRSRRGPRPSTAFLIEAAPEREHGIFASLRFMIQDLAVLTAGLVGWVLSSAFSTRALDAWAWRLAVLLGAAIIPFGNRLRQALPDKLLGGPTIAGYSPSLRSTLGRQPWSAVLLEATAIVSDIEVYLTTDATSNRNTSATMSFLLVVVTELYGVVFGQRAVCSPISLGANR